VETEDVGDDITSLVPPDVEIDETHGFQNEPGFEVDEVAGILQAIVVRCHSQRNPTPKERILVFLPSGPNGKVVARVHDYVGIRRVHGRQMIHDLFSGINFARDRVFELLKKTTIGVAIEKAKVLLAAVRLVQSVTK
jgi:hypothetical protein